jgi:hypothetical protein
MGWRTDASWPSTNLPDRSGLSKYLRVLGQVVPDDVGCGVQGSVTVGVVADAIQDLIECRLARVGAGQMDV